MALSNPMQARGVALQAADMLQGWPVISVRGELLGTIEEIVIDAARGEVAYALVRQEYPQDFAGRMVATPWVALTESSTGGEFVLAVEHSRLFGLPSPVPAG